MGDETDLPEECELQLAERAKSGDRTAFDRLRLRLEPDIRRFIRRLIPNSPSVDDVLQDAFLSLYMNLDRLEPVANLRPFLFRIVRNRCYDELRAKGRYSTVPLHEVEDGTPESRQLVDAAATPDEAVQRLLMLSEVQQAIDSLPEPQRQALILFAEEGMSVVEVAEALGTEVGTVKSRIHHARRSMLRRITPATRAGLGIGKETENGE